MYVLLWPLGCRADKAPRGIMAEKKDERSKGGLSDEQLDKMIDEGVQRQKKEDSSEKKEERKKEEPKKEEKKEEKDRAAPAVPTTAPAAAPAPTPITEYDPWGVLMYPNLAEKAMNMVELENKLVFVVRKDANKNQIKEAVEKGFDVRVLQVNVEITPKGHKKAYIKLDPKDSAADIASRMGML